MPRGNVLLKPTELEIKDVRLKLDNLKKNGFNGYVQINVPGTAFYVFLKEGHISGVIHASDHQAALISELLLFYRLRAGVCRVSSFVLAPELVDVLCHWHAFGEKYLNYQVLKKEFRKVLSSLDSDKITGMIEIQVPEENTSVYFLLNQGRVATDPFLDFYGQIVTGPDKVSQVIQKISGEGGLISCYGERFDVLERKRKMSLEEMEKYKELAAAAEPGLIPLVSGGVVRVDESVLREWSRYGNVARIEILARSGGTVSLKVQGKKGLGNRISMAGSLQKKLGISNNDPVLVRPERA